MKIISYVLAYLCLMISPSYAWQSSRCAQIMYDGKTVLYEKTYRPWTTDLSNNDRYEFSCNNKRRVNPIQYNYVRIDGQIYYLKRYYNEEKNCKFYSLECLIARNPSSSAFNWVYVLKFEYYLLPNQKGHPIKKLTELSERYPLATDGTYLYYKDQILQDAVLSTTSKKDLRMPVKALEDSDYLLVGNNVVYQGSIIPKADAESFELLGKEQHIADFSQDNAAVYYKGKALQNSDPKTFKILTDRYSEYRDLSLDNNHVYWKNDIIPLADPATFEIHDYLLEDANHVWAFNKKNGPELKNNYQANLQKLNGAYSKNDSQVFYYDQLLDGADTSTFNVLTYSCTQDNPQCKDDGKLCEISANLNCLHKDKFYPMNDYNLAVDKNNFYKYGKVVETIDSNTFQWLYFDQNSVIGMDENSFFNPITGYYQKITKPLFGPFIVDSQKNHAIILMSDNVIYFLNFMPEDVKTCTKSVGAGEFRKIQVDDPLVYYAIENDDYQFMFTNKTLDTRNEDYVIKKSTGERHTFLGSKLSPCQLINNIL